MDYSEKHDIVKDILDVWDMMYKDLLDSLKNLPPDSKQDRMKGYAAGLSDAYRLCMMTEEQMKKCHDELKEWKRKKFEKLGYSCE